MGGWRWMRPLRAGLSPASGPGGFYVVVVVVALLFCHGAFGYAHQLPPAEASATHAAHAAGGHQPGADGEAGVPHLGGAYFATLLVLLFWALLLPGGGRSAALRVPVVAGARGDRRVGGLPPPRGPTLFSLQVFRL
ncbi:MAG: hypothetical protein AVDCRST_MAG05-3334 [uncultured Rubrobacteraceae bacterium]|uniref:Uncharacterized protein n=1 Tax=uncultured Rubrobacteraceae bacterium TaxID=349277 RepID=A0A6J4T7Z3_9ACTN|nr:MAG: hypothetical protein AVDCRST_MAG05-3334 [uncultured Rubrobacteraceae bacterium]